MDSSFLPILELKKDRLCGLVVRVSVHRSRGPGFESRPLSIVRTTEELLGRKSRGSGLEDRD
jgi:hypothetical protein